MAKLAGDAYVYAHDGAVYAPGDELPKELRHLSDEPDVSTDDASASAGTGNAEEDAKIEALSVPKLREALTKEGVEFSDADRKDRLVQLLKGARTS